MVEGRLPAMKPSRESVIRARKLRRTMTPPERRLWNVLRTSPEGFKFRKQHPLGPYTPDFFCHSAALAVEVDGIAHEMGDNVRRDARRDRWIAEQGIEVLRVPALALKHDLEGVVQQVLSRCAERSPPQ
jgi:very-short-patch-repair endonuclease